ENEGGIEMGEEKVLLEFEMDMFGIKGDRIPREYYTLTNERIKIRKQGLLTKELNDIELFKIKDTSVKQKMTDKVRNVGDIEIISADESDPVIVLKKVKDPHEVREKIRRAVKEAKEKAGVTYRYDL